MNNDSVDAIPVIGCMACGCMVDNASWNDMVVCNKCVDSMNGCERWLGIDTTLRHDNKEIRIFRRSDNSWNIAVTGPNSADPVRPIMYKRVPLSFCSKGGAVVAAFAYHRNIYE